MSRHKLHKAVLFLGDLGVFLVTALFLLREAAFPAVFAESTHFRGILSLIASWSIVYFALGLYDFQRMRSIVDMLQDDFLAIAFNVPIAVAILRNLGWTADITSIEIVLLVIITAHSFTLAWRYLWVRLISSRIMVQRIAFFGDSKLIRMMREDIRNCSQLSFKEAAYHAGQPMKTVADLLVVDTGEKGDGASIEDSIYSLAFVHDIPVMSHLDFYERIYHKVPPMRAGTPAWLLMHILPRKKHAYFIFKRFFDLIIAALGLLLFLPVLMAIALVSKLIEKGPIFYYQKRCGYLSKHFFICKFRTMHLGSDKSGPLWHIPSTDERITLLGKFLRRFRLDEIPQLWNVIKGDMSLVGPRPEWIEEVRVLDRTVPHYRLRHLLKPGITGWAQINFRATNSSEDSFEKLQFDLYYLKNISLALDVGILLKTAKRIFIKESAFDRALSTHAKLKRENSRIGVSTEPHPASDRTHSTQLKRN